MFSLIHKIRNIKNLILDHLQQLRDELKASHQNEAEILTHTSSLLENNATLIAASSHLVRAIEMQMQEYQKSHAELLRQVKFLQQQQQNYRDALLSMSFRIQPQLISTKHEAIQPDVALMMYLYSFLPSRNAVDIGAGTGTLSHQLLEAGYVVHAFEPFAPAFRELTLSKASCGNSTNWLLFELAIGAVDGWTTLQPSLRLEADKDSGSFESERDEKSASSHQPAIANQYPVEMRSLESLHQERLLPDDVCLVSVRIGGRDLEVIRGMGDRCYEVVVTEFWDEQHPRQIARITQELVLLANVVEAMQQRGYHWYIVISRNIETGEPSFHCNYKKAPKQTWGKVFFFQRYDVFAQALKWCSAILSPTYFIT